jgi:hypothetical protein
LEWWRRMTDIPVTVIASGWKERAISRCDELQRVTERGGEIVRAPEQPLIANRRLALSKFYASGAQWGIIMDDDAILYDSPEHNSGAAFFAEMAANGSSAYADVDVFFPVNPAKQGFRPLWGKDPALYRDNHVFDRNQDLKGSMFVVRNLPQFGRRPVFPHTNYELHGEDTLFAIEALANGCTVMRAGNIVLQELKSVSFFSDRKGPMKEGNQRLVEIYGALGLKMRKSPGKDHLTDKTEFLKCAPGTHPRQVVVKKPAPFLRPW